MAIGIFDSGIGGLSVYKHLKNRFNDQKIIYFADTHNFPYGKKSSDQIIQYSKNILDFFISQNVTTVLIACNTASSIAIDDLKNNYQNINIYGVIEPVAKYIIQKDYTNIVLLATEGTINSKIYDKYLENRIIKRIKAPLLVESIQEYNKENIKRDIQYYLSEIKQKNANIILGCTHFPIVLKMIKQLYDFNLIDPAKNSVDEIDEIIDDKGDTIFYVSGDVEDFKRKAQIILEKEDIDVRIHKWDTCR